MRNTFSDVMRSRKVDIAREFRRLYELVYGDGEFHIVMRNCFEYMPFRGTAIDLDDFEHECNLSFAVVNDVSLESLLGFAEYVYNFAFSIKCSINPRTICFEQEADSVIWHIQTLVEKLDYKFSYDGKFYILVEANNESWVAAEVAPEEIVSDLVNYAYRGLTGDLDAKRAKLIKMINAIEPKRRHIKSLCKPLEDDLFFLANNFNIRHNNLDAGFPKQYNSYLESLSDQELEAWYDEAHRMCIAATLLLHFDEKRNELEQLKPA